MVEAEEIFNIFDRKYAIYKGRFISNRKKGMVSIADIKQIFNNNVDFKIPEDDINEFFKESDIDQDGMLNKTEFFQSYIFSQQNKAKRFFLGFPIFKDSFQND